MDTFMKSLHVGDDVTLTHGDNVISGKIQRMTDDSILLRVNSQKCEAEATEEFTEIRSPYTGYVGRELGDSKMFYGRDDIINELLQSMRINGRFNYGSGVLLYGQTRVGKSSIQHNFIRRVRAVEPDVIVVDLGNLYSFDLTMASFYVKLLDRFTTEVERNHPQFARLMARKSLQAPIEQILLMQEHAKLLFDRYLDCV